MSFTVFLGNLPAWVTADDIKGWLSAENLVADAIKVIRNPETQESKGFAFIDAPNADEMNSIIRRFDRAPLEDRLLRANPAQPPKPKSQSGRPPHVHGGGQGGSSSGHSGGSHAGPQGGPSAGGPASGNPSAAGGQAHNGSQFAASERPARRGKRSNPRRENDGPQSAFAEELARAL